MRPIQYFSDEYLQQCKKMRPEEILRFLEEFRILNSSSNGKSRLISLKIPESMLELFKLKARLEGKKYQTQIKSLMQSWINGDIKENLDSF